MPMTFWCCGWPLGVVVASALWCAGSAGAASRVPIPALQGEGERSPFTGQRVVTEGVVTLLTDTGFFLQDPVGDANPRTSDGVFVHTAAVPQVSVGQRAHVAGVVAEYGGGPAGRDTLPAATTLTELTHVTVLSARAAGSPVRPVPLRLPLPDGVTLERYEGMRVTLQGPLAVASSRSLGALGQLVLHAGPRPRAPTDVTVPGPAARALAEGQARHRIVLDDALNRRDPHPAPFGGPGPVVRAGAAFATIDGVLDQGAVSPRREAFGYRVQPVGRPRLVPAPPRPEAPPDVGGAIKVAGFNVLNYFTTLNTGPGSCAPHGACRGARDAQALARQRARLVEALRALDAHVVGLMEIENNGEVALRDLVDALNARAGAGRYAVVPAPEGGTGSDATRVALIHQPARVTAVGRAAADTAVVHERAPLAQAFQVAGGGRLLVVVGHLKSKRCDGAVGADADRGDGQGCFNERRVRQAEALQRFALGLRERAGTTDVLLLGDFNAHAREDPVRHLTEAGRWHDLLARWAPAAYTHVFDGVASRLDAAFASPSLASQVAGAAVWHINADESPPPVAAEPDAKGGALAFRSSDHDPVVIGIHLRSKSHPPLSRAGASPWKVPVRADTSGHAARPPP